MIQPPGVSEAYPRHLQASSFLRVEAKNLRRVYPLPGARGGGRRGRGVCRSYCGHCPQRAILARPHCQDHLGGVPQGTEEKVSVLINFLLPWNTSQLRVLFEAWFKASKSLGFFTK
jgi:hypothetical protein